MSEKLCECGCGQPTPPCKYNLKNYGYIKGKPLRFVPGHQNRGREWSKETISKRGEALNGHPVSAETREKISRRHKELGTHPSAEAHAKSIQNRPTGMDNPSWRGGKSITNGYMCTYRPNHPRSHPNGYVYEHILIAEEILGRPLEPKEVVHHIDGDKFNNSHDNLLVLPSQTEHIHIHRLQGDLP